MAPRASFQTKLFFAAFSAAVLALLVAGVLFVALTIPLARLTDWLGRRALVRERGR